LLMCVVFDAPDDANLQGRADGYEPYESRV